MTNNKQQTAVEWIETQILDLIPNDIGSQLKFKNKIKQAKERDKEQKLNMFNCGRQYQVTGEGTFKQVYQEIHGGDEQ